MPFQVQVRRLEDAGQQAHGRRQGRMLDRRGGRLAGDGHHLARLPGEQAAGAEALQEGQHIAVFGVDDVRADVEHVAGLRMRPARRPAAQAARRFQHRHLQALVGQRHRAGQPRQAAADHHHLFLVHAHSLPFDSAAMLGEAGCGIGSGTHIGSGNAAAVLSFRPSCKRRS
jgi:hypothetical protein